MLKSNCENKKTPKGVYVMIYGERLEELKNKYYTLFEDGSDMEELDFLGESDTEGEDVGYLVEFFKCEKVYVVRYGICGQGFSDYCNFEAFDDYEECIKWINNNFKN